jgi:hypothetical protein
MMIIIIIIIIIIILKELCSNLQNTRPLINPKNRPSSNVQGNNLFTFLEARRIPRYIQWKENKI